MAFYNWVDDTNLSNVLGMSSFGSDSQRESGFQAGDVASAIRVNSGLRQANLVACALMDALNIGTNPDAGLTTPRTNMKALISDALNYGLSYIKLSGSDQVTGSIIPKNHNEVDLGANSKRWRNVYANDVTYSGGTLSGLKTQVQNNNTATSLALSVQNARIENLQESCLYGETYYITEPRQSDVFRTDSFMMVKSGPIVQITFKGSAISPIANAFDFMNIPDERAQFRPVSELRGNTKMLGMAIRTSGSGGDYGRIYYDASAKDIMCKFSSLGAGAEIYGTATWIVDYTEAPQS